MSDEVPTPQHDKLREVQHLSQNAHEFLEWLSAKGIELAVWHPRADYLVPVTESRDDLLYEFFGIDQAAFHAEKDAILAAFQRTLATKSDERAGL